jgi:hypothetical protein
MRFKVPAIPGPVWIVLVVVVAPVFLAGHRRHTQVDVNSGRTRESPALWSFGYWWTEHDTALSRTLTGAGVTLGPPDWHFTHTAGGSARINYRYGGIETSVNHLTSWFDPLELSESERVRLCQAALNCLKDARGFTVVVDDERTITPRIELVGFDGVVIASSPPRNDHP